MNWPGEQLIIKLWETLTEKGVGGLIRPWQMRREGLAQIDVRRAEVLALADAEREAAEIRSGRKKLQESRLILALPIERGSQAAMDQPQSFLALTQPIDELDSSAPPLEPQVVDTAVNGIVADAVRREVNVAAAIICAEKELRDDPRPVPDGTINDDWLFRWREYAGATSADELRTLWGRLLAGEVKVPGAFALRTLEFLRNLSAADARLIERASRFVLDGAISNSHTPLFEREGLSFSALLELQEMGFLAGTEAIGGISKTYKSLRPDRFISLVRSHGKAILVEHEDSSRSFSFSAFVVTTVGRQVLSLGTFEPHEHYLEEVGREIKNQGFSVSVVRYRESGDKIQWFDQRTL